MKKENRGGVRTSLNKKLRIMKATKKTVESVEYWLEGCSSYFQETKEEFWNGINAGLRGFYFFKYTDGSYSDSIYAKSFERL